MHVGRPSLPDGDVPLTLEDGVVLLFLPSRPPFGEELRDFDPFPLDLRPAVLPLGFSGLFIFVVGPGTFVPSAAFSKLQPLPAISLLRLCPFVIALSTSSWGSLSAATQVIFDFVASLLSDMGASHGQ